MRIRGLGTARRVAGWARSYFRGGPIILGYHQVAHSNWDPQRLCVSPENFAEQLRVLTDTAHSIRLGELTDALCRGEHCDKAFVLTFDDGYEDTLTTALPILTEYEVAGTVFVTTGVIGKRFWWNETQNMVESMTELPDGVMLNTGDHSFRWTKSSDSRRDRARLIRELGDYFRTLPFEHQEDALDAVRKTLDPANPLSGIRAMTAEQVAVLSSSDLIDIGSHAVTHTSLNQMDADAQRHELQRSKADLESICGTPVVACSYPNGRISKDTPAIAREAGYTSGCASHEELVPPGCDPLQLPRLWVGDWNGDQFARWLRWWLR